jgi:aspartate carbamoyltransferase catalytic subunit
MPDEFLDVCKERNVDYNVSKDFSADIINESDIIYMTRVQRERFSDLMEYERVKDLYTLNNAMLADSKPNVRILHPLPRVNEINQDVDDNPKAYYFEQAKNGLYARQAMICRALQIKP